MRLIPPGELSRYFYRENGLPTVTAGIPLGAVCIDQTDGHHYILLSTGWQQYESGVIPGGFSDFTLVDGRVTQVNV